MKSLLEELFPIYRTLCGPGALETLKIVQRELPDLKIMEYPSGTDVCGWTIPKEFTVNEAYVGGRDGEGLINLKQHPYCLWVYSQPLSQTVQKEELLKHLSVGPHNEIQLRQTYYKKDWGFCVNQAMLANIEEDSGPFYVHIDAEHKDGFLRIGECYLPAGELEAAPTRSGCSWRIDIGRPEILINSYTCHPRGANDNCSGIVACVELFKRLQSLRKRRYSYRLCLWPETIGPITWIAKHIGWWPIENGEVKPYAVNSSSHNILCALTIAICGDKTELKYDASISGASDLDRAFSHLGVIDRRYSGFMGATDSRHFNGMGVNIPAVTLTRGGPCNYPEYHSSADTPDIISEEALEETVDTAFKALQVIERNRVFRPNYITTPCLQKHGIFPYQHGTGNGGATRTDQARAYFELMYLVDGQRDLLSIADSQGMSIFDFDEPVEKFLAAGLISEA